MNNFTSCHLRRIGSPASLTAIPDIFELEKDVTIIGRAKHKVDLYLDSANYQGLISRIHARIFKTKSKTGEECYKICDTSLNGTFVNDIKILNEVPLKHGDTVAFGHLKGAALQPGLRYPQPKSEFYFKFERVTQEHGKQVTNNRDGRTTEDITMSPMASMNSMLIETPTPVLTSVDGRKSCQTKRELEKNFLDSDSDLDIFQEYASAAQLAADLEQDSDEDLFSIKYTDILPGGALINHLEDTVPDNNQTSKRKANYSHTKSPSKVTKQDNLEICAAAKCLQPTNNIIPWVQCDDCDLWYHIKCAGLTMRMVKPKNAKFHCGCR